MNRYQTDDEAHPEVSACLAAELRLKWTNRKEKDCDTNLAYKSAICSIAIEDQRFDGTLAECVHSAEMIPSVVSEGAG